MTTTWDRVSQAFGEPPTSSRCKATSNPPLCRWLSGVRRHVFHDAANFPKELRFARPAHQSKVQCHRLAPEERRVGQRRCRLGNRLPGQ
jgi:hypothetical protein